MNHYAGMFTPLLLHLIVTELVAAGVGEAMDSAGRVLLASLFVLPAAGWMYWRDERNRIGKGEQARAKRGTGARAVLVCLACFLAGGLLNLAWSRILVMLGLTRAFSNAAQERLFSAGMAVQLLSMGIAAPLTEELLFRGLIYRRMREFFPAAGAALLSALLFAVYHGNVIQMVFAFPMALVLAVLYEKGGRFWYPLCFHMGCNLTAIVFYWWNPL